MTGCRHNAKNTLVKNYLHLAEANGASVLPLDHGHAGLPRVRTAGTTCHVRHTRAKVPRRRTASRVLTADQVVFAASALGTQRLLHRMMAEGHLPGLSDPSGRARPHQLRVDPRLDRAGRLGRLHARVSRSRPPSTPTRYTHIEPVRYGKGSQRDVPDADRAHRW